MKHIDQLGVPCCEFYLAVGDNGWPRWSPFLIGLKGVIMCPVFCYHEPYSDLAAIITHFTLSHLHGCPALADWFGWSSARLKLFLEKFWEKSAIYKHHMLEHKLLSMLHIPHELPRLTENYVKELNQYGQRSF